MLVVHILNPKVSCNALVLISLYYVSCSDISDPL